MAAFSFADTATGQAEARRARGWSVRCILLGFTALTLGAALYVAARPAASVYLLPYKGQALLASGSTLAVTGVLPTFLHVLAFSLLTAAVLRPGGVRAFVAIAGTWLGVNAILEVGQHARLAPAVASALPASFDDVPVLENLGSYLLQGTFDVADLLAATAGAVAAVLIMAWPYSLRRSS